MPIPLRRFAVLFSGWALAACGSDHPGPVTCTSFTYSAWTPSVCPESGLQTRTLLSSEPAGCIGGSPVLTRACTPATIVFTNATLQTVQELHLVPAGASDWGAPVNGAPIASYGTFTITAVPPGSYSRRAIIRDSIGSYFADSLDFPVAAGESLSVSADEGDYTGSVAVSNADAVYSLVEIEVMPRPVTSWGPNQLPFPLAPGATFVFPGLRSGPYEVRCVHATGAVSTTVQAVYPLGTTDVLCP